MFRKKYTLVLNILFACYISSSFAYSTRDGKIIDNNNQIIAIDGVNWAGFQDSGFVDELYGAIPFYSLPTRADFGILDMLTHPWDNPKTGVDKNSGVVFKTIRLPMQPANLYDTSENKHFRLDLTDTKNKRAGNGVFCKEWNAQTCQKGLTNSESLFKIIEEFKHNNIKVLVDFHQNPTGRNGNVVESNFSLSDYKNAVAFLAQQLKKMQLTNVIGIDVFNEPHNLDWYHPVDSQPAWVEVIAQAAIAVYENNPELLLFVEGANSNEQGSEICISSNIIPVDQSSYSLISDASVCDAGKYRVVFKANWGEDFKALLEPNAAKQSEAMFDIKKFRSHICQRTGEAVCNWLLGNPDDSLVQGHLVFSPHIYGQHVAGWQSTVASSLFRFDWNFGFLIKAGYPIVIGEAGYDTKQVDDITFFEKSIAPYLKAKGINHQLFYWTWNTNSGDTGGVRADLSSIELDYTKEKDLNSLFSDNE